MAASEDSYNIHTVENSLTEQSLNSDHSRRLQSLESMMRSMQATINQQSTTIAMLNRELSIVRSNSVLELDGLLKFSKINGYPTAEFTTVNVQINDGSGDTAGEVNGLGNLTVGYNEIAESNQSFCSDPEFTNKVKCENNAKLWANNVRRGSHNLIIGLENSYDDYASIVAGHKNTVNAPFATITGGSFNFAIGEYSSISGGFANSARGPAASVSGGGGNSADALASHISGGHDNHVVGQYSSVNAGSLNTVIGFYAGINGGRGNVAFGDYSSINGGYYNEVEMDFSSIGGGQLNRALGRYSYVCGGFGNTATGDKSTVCGGSGNTANGHASSVSGGFEREANEAHSWAAGSLLEDQ